MKEKKNVLQNFDRKQAQVALDYETSNHPRRMHRNGAQFKDIDEKQTNLLTDSKMGHKATLPVSEDTCAQNKPEIASGANPNYLIENTTTKSRHLGAMERNAGYEQRQYVSHLLEKNDTPTR